MKTSMLLLRASAACALLLATLPTASAAFTSSLKNQKLTLQQVSNGGPVLIDNNGAAGAFRVFDGGVSVFVAANSLVVKLADNTSSGVIIDLDNPLLRDLTLKLGNGMRSVEFAGSSNRIGGHLTIEAGVGDQTIELAANAPLTVDGDLKIDLGDGDDLVDEDGNDVTVAGDMTFRGVNRFENNGNLLVAGDVLVQNDNESLFSEFDNDLVMTFLGDFRYVGGSGVDSVLLNADTVIGGDVNIKLGTGPVPGLGQYAYVNSGGCRVGGNLTVKSGVSAGDSFEAHPDLAVGGKMKINLGDGPNTASIEGRCAGSTVSYHGGDGADNVFVRLLARGTAVKIDLDGGSDTFTLGAGPNSLKSLFVDFGKGSDTFFDSLGATSPFKTKTMNLP